MSVKILAIETSCDDTCAAVVVDGTEILSNVISSQAKIHARFGGVVPEVASRKHLELINSVIQRALDEAGLDFGSLNAIGVTYGPGLAGALLVGVAAAKAIAYALDMPLLAINHIEGHVYANFLLESDLSFPLICLVVSGGHTDLVLIQSHGDYKLVGSTRDDAAGETFDKVARSMGLGYPGGPLIDKLSIGGKEEIISFPRAYLEEGTLDFSFSGLKTAVVNYLRLSEQQGRTVNKTDLAASFQKAIVDVLVDKTLLAAEKYEVNAILLAGGVAANARLRSHFRDRAGQQMRTIVYPPALLCTDNAAMIGCAAYYKYMRSDLAPLTLNAVPGLKLGEKKYGVPS